MVRIDASKIEDWGSFHRVFADAFGFPDFYGNNMNAWIDCLSYVNDPEAGMTRIHVAPGATLALIIDNARSFKQRCPEQYLALVECAAFVNWRMLEHEFTTATAPPIALAFSA